MNRYLIKERGGRYWSTYGYWSVIGTQLTADVLPEITCSQWVRPGTYDPETKTWGENGEVYSTAEEVICSD